MHRVMNERMKCFNVHGHTYLYKLVFGFEQMEEIGYAVDFKEIKRVYMQWIDDYLDHAAIVNPVDHKVISLCLELNSKMWTMSLEGNEYCNPTVENIAIELFLAIDALCTESSKGKLTLQAIELNETPNCKTTLTRDVVLSMSGKKIHNFLRQNLEELVNYAKQKGTVEYDDRNVTGK